MGNISSYNIESDPVVIAVIAVKVSLIFISILGNTMVILAVVLDSTVRRISNNIFVCSLAISDFLIGAFVMPIDLLEIIHCWSSDDDNTISFLRWVFLRASIWSLVIISYDRLQYVKRVKRYINAMHGYKVMFYACFGWIMGIFIASLLLVGKIKEGKWDTILYITGCSIDFFIPSIAILICYQRIFSITKERMTRLSPPENNLILRRTTLIMGILVVAFVSIYLQEYVVDVYYRLNSGERYKCVALSATRWVVYSNSCVNPIVYAMTNKSFRAAMWRIMTCNCFEVRHPSMARRDTATRFQGRQSVMRSFMESSEQRYEFSVKPVIVPMIDREPVSINTEATHTSRNPER